MVHGDLTDIAGAIADGEPIDWAALGADADAWPPGLTGSARIVERVALVHASLAPAAFLGSSLHASIDPHTTPEGDPGEPITWGPLTIVERIGRGTFGDVYRAHDRRLNRLVALKLLRRKDRLESLVIEEGQMMARVRHPNVVTIYGAERIDTRVGLWMQFVDGPTLEQELRARGPLSPAEVRVAGVQLAQALEAVHRAGLLHRDIKAQNAMRDADGRVLLTDFGTGRELVDNSAADGRELVGTPLYMAPEVLAGFPASIASDVYGLGVLLFHLATGSFPMTGRSLRELRDGHARGRRASVASVRGDLPKRLAAVIDRATASDPSHRYTSAGELETALSTSFPSRVRLTVAAAAVALSVVAASGTGLWLWRSPPVNVPSEFQLRDAVLVTRFENSSGNRNFEGVLEQATAAGLSAAGSIDIVPTERVIDALRMMKRPVETIVDGAIGREVSLRDGRVKALVTGRITKADGGYVLTTELIDPADGSIVGSVSSPTGTAATAVAAANRGGQELGALLRAQRSRVKGAVPLQQLSTTSLEALRLYNEAIRVYWANGQAEDAIPINRRALAEDETFAGAWMFQAFLLKQLPDSPTRDVGIRLAAERAMALAENLPDWERHFLRGVHRWLNDAFVAAMPDFDTAVRLRPDFEPAARFLTNSYLWLGQPASVLSARRAAADQRPSDIAANFFAAFSIVHLRQNADEARPYIDRLDQLLTPSRAGAPLFYRAAQWRRLLPAYEAWLAGDLSRAQAIVDHEAELLPSWPAERQQMQAFIGSFYTTLGRLRDAEHVLRGAHPFDLAAFAEIRDDVSELRRLVQTLPPDIHVERLVRAGLLDEARERLTRGASDPLDRDVLTIGRAALALEEGHARETIALLPSVLQRGTHLSAIYHKGCDLLASALLQENRRPDAIAEIERCITTLPMFFGRFNAGYWMKLQMRLADEYRAAHRLSEAERVEDRLRRLLVFADGDHPLVVRLQKVGS